MSLFQCEKCGCCENTALGYYWPTIISKEPKVCSECHTGTWHNKFRKILLPLGMFITNKEGNLAHKETGDTELENYEVKP